MNEGLYIKFSINLNIMRKGFTFLFLFFVGLGVSQSNLIDEKKIDYLFQQYNLNTPGVAVSVVKNGQIVFSKGYGMANLEYNVPITPQTIFHVASVSKQFTAFAVYLCASKGLLSLEDDVRLYIPELPKYDSVIKIKHLLFHTSGLKDQWALLTLAGWRMDDVITTEQILKLVTRQKDLNFETGTEFAYSNTGYSLLAEIVSRVTGMSFAEYTKQNIFNPLGMENSFFNDDHEKIIKNRSYSYAANEEGYIKQKLSYANVGATSLFTTVIDLGKWVMNFENPIIGDEEMIHNFNALAKLDNGEPVVLAVVDGETIYHAKGQFFRTYRGVDIYNHTGGDAGFRTYLVRYPKESVSVILLSNDANFDRLGNGLKIGEFFLENKYQELPTEGQGIETNEEESTPDLVTTDLKEYVGTYYNEALESTFDVVKVKDRMVFRHLRLDDAPMEISGTDEFQGYITFPVKIIFERVADGHINGFRVSNFGAKNVYFKLIK